MDNGKKGQLVSTTLTTKIPAPRDLTIDELISATLTIRWTKALGLEQTPQHFLISYCSPGKEPIIVNTEDCYRTLSDLQPGTQYTVSVSTVLNNGLQSEPASTNACTVLPAPDQLTVDSVDTTSATVIWNQPPGLDQTHHQYQISYQCPGTEPHITTTSSPSITLSDLKPATEYTVTVCTVLENGNTSDLVSTAFTTEVPEPCDLTIEEIKSTSLTIKWTMALGLHQTPHHFLISYCSQGNKTKTVNTEDCYRTLSDLQPGTQYTVSVSTVLNKGLQSKPVSTNVCTVPLAPDQLTVDSLDTTSATVIWNQPPGLDQTHHHYQISYQCPGTEPHITTTSSHSITLSDLKPATEYSVTVCTVLGKEKPNSLFKKWIWAPVMGILHHISLYKNEAETQSSAGIQSEPVSTTICTVPLAPDQLTIDSVDTTSATVIWNQPPGLDQTHHHYQISYQCPGTEPHITTTSSPSITLSDLKPATEYSVTVCTVMDNGKKSQLVSTTLNTKCLEIYMKKLGLTQKLSVNTILAIDGQMLDKKSVPSFQFLPYYFLRELIKKNVSVRDVQCTHEELVNPLDLITALFHGSDGLLQQEIVLNMSMCQFAVPLLLYNCDTKQSTLMLWALRDIVKKYRPHSMKDQNSFIENSIVLTDMPMVSFVRLGHSSLSKSQLLNEVLSESQQKNHAFVHRNMPTGNIPRRISDGLVEISWYLPSGKPTDVFPEPVAVANLRGDIKDFQKQLSFLCKTSAAVFLFSNDLGSHSHILNHQQMKSPLFIVCNSQDENYLQDSFEKHALKFQKCRYHLIKKDRKMNDAQLVMKLHSDIIEVVCRKPFKTSVEKMSAVAYELGLSVDEDQSHCQKAKKMALLITDSISDITDFKKNNLPLQGETLQTLANIEREECKLKDAGNCNIELYKANLKEQKNKLRLKQVQNGMKENLSQFINGLKSSKEERCYFLKWMKLNLDNLSRKTLSQLKEEYKKLCKTSPHKEVLANLESKISSCSLGTEHFLREMGQLYESAMLLPELTSNHKDLQELPQICAQLMLDSFPLELMNGDASNIPIKWISDVLVELHNMTKPNNRIRVITVL
ncbi:hypothetical protein UPYG_G00043650, partial [Umbra pygmaea]